MLIYIGKVFFCNLTVSTVLALENLKWQDANRNVPVCVVVPKVAKASTVMTVGNSNMTISTFLAWATLGDMTQVEMILFVSCHPR